MKRKCLSFLATIVAVIAMSPSAEAQSGTYLHLEYAQAECDNYTSPSASATFRASIGTGALHPWVDRKDYRRYNNNTLDVWIWHYTSLANYRLEAGCRVVGSDAYKWVQSFGLGYVQRNP